MEDTGIKVDYNNDMTYFSLGKHRVSKKLSIPS